MAKVTNTAGLIMSGLRLQILRAGSEVAWGRGGEQGESKSPYYTPAILCKF